MKPLPDSYNHQIVEKHWQNHWHTTSVYAWDESQSRENTFVIDTPPPTVSGLLHMGHIFSYTQADFVARYQRMKGKTVFYPMGFDDNGLPTERLVEKLRDIRAANMPREEFIGICREVVEDAENEFRALFKTAALSVDWSQEYQTISPQSRAISQLSFVDLYEKSKVYRRLQPTLWDTADRTALAQADVEDKEMPSQMNDVQFTLEDGTPVVIATTRPELLAACVAVFCHPEDARYTKYIGKTAITPLFGVKVPVLADPHVDQEKGTGLVMCCTFGDIQDIAWWKEHKLPTRVIVDAAGRLCNMEGLGQDEWVSVDRHKAQGAIAELNGLKIKAAREKILELLKAEGLVLKQTDLVHSVKCAERSGNPLEILVTHQWFISVVDEKEGLLKKSAECNWYPAHMKIRMDQWIEGLSWDWCISRQRYFGVPFPVWYSKRAGEEGKILVATPDQLPVDPLVDLPKGYTRDEVQAETDVMDTWATSSVSPQLNSRGISSNHALDAERHKKLFPADLRPQAHEIIRSWAFYTVVKAHLHENTVPWKNLMISGWCLAADKTKMSKSKGNVVTPVALLEEKGSDVVRYWASTSRLGSDTAYSEDVLKIGKKLTNKIWNASKFAALHLTKLQQKPGTAKQDVDSGVIFETLDLWILTRLQRTIAKATAEFEKFEYCNARTATEEFFWKDFCDNYLELIKVRAYNEDGSNPKGQQSAIHTVYHCLDALLRLFAPVVPHITEELFSYIFDEKGSVHARGTWPDAVDYPEDAQSERAGIACVSVLDGVRKLKATKNVSIKWPLDEIVLGKGSVDASTWADIEPLTDDLKNVTNASAIRWGNDALEDVTPTDNGWFTVSVKFGEKSDAA